MVKTYLFALSRHVGLLVQCPCACRDADGITGLNKVYMRVLRRISGDLRFGALCEKDNREVRKELGQPSLDCLLVRKRLLYVGRLLRRGPRALVALLQSRPGGSVMPWTGQMLNDLETIFDVVVAPDGSKLLRPSSGAENSLL